MTARQHQSDAGRQPCLVSRWLRFLLIVAVTLPLAWFAGSQAAGMALTRFSPEIAVKAAPGNGEALARLAELKLASAVQEADSNELPLSLAEPLWHEARKAFLQAPLAARAIRIAALSREATGDEQLARYLMLGVVELTKRDLGTHLWLIHDYGKSGDLTNLLNHYDFALRTSNQAASILLPRLTLVLKAPGTVEVLVPVLAQQPPWAQQFWRTTYVNPETLPQAAKLRLALLERNIPVPDDVDRRLILSLARDREWDAAANLYGRVAGDDAPALDRVGEADFSRVPQLAPIEWNFPSSGLQSGEIAPETRRMILSGGPASSGVAAMRVVALEPGRYELHLEREEAETSNRPTLAVEIVCVDEVPQRRIARFREEGSTIHGFFEADASCSYYALQVHLRVPRNSISGQVILEEMALRPA